jgi:type 1 glutamine amidotransferase
MTPAGKAALLAAIAGGKGFIGLHSATDTFHTASRNGHVPERFLDDGAAADDFVKMIGGEFIRHGKQQVAKVTVIDPKFPGVSAVPAGYAPQEEWYSLKNFAPDLHVLLVQETAGMEGEEYQRAPYPMTWARKHGKGRVFYTSMGHREDIWTSPVYQSLLEGALNWAVGRVKADVSPNLSTAAPGANRLPVYVAPAPKPAPATPKAN